MISFICRAGEIANLFTRRSLIKKFQTISHEDWNHSCNSTNTKTIQISKNGNMNRLNRNQMFLLATDFLALCFLPAFFSSNQSNEIIKRVTFIDNLLNQTTYLFSKTIKSSIKITIQCLCQSLCSSMLFQLFLL